MKFVLSLCIFAIAQLAHATELFPSSAPRTFSLGEQLENDATIGSYPIWQGERKWRVYDLATRSSGGSAMPVPLADARFFQTEGGKLVAIMSVSANLAQANADDWVDDPCKRDDLLFKLSSGRSFKNVNCVTINHITGFPGNPNGAAANLYALLKENSIDIPPTVIQLVFTRYASNLRRLSVTLFVNPELVGIPRAAEVQWGRNPWHKSQSANDPDKTRFVDGLSAWAKQFAKQMDLAFDKNPDAFTAIPSWRAIPELNNQNGATKPKIKLD